MSSFVAEIFPNGRSACALQRLFLADLGRRRCIDRRVRKGQRGRNQKPLMARLGVWNPLQSSFMSWDHEGALLAVPCAPPCLWISAVELRVLQEMSQRFTA